MTISKCPVCELGAEIKYSDHGNQLVVDCDRCGQFGITKRAASSAERWAEKDSLFRSKLSHWIRKAQKQDDYPSLDGKYLIDLIDQLKLPNVIEQTKSLLSFLGNNLNTPTAKYHILMVQLWSYLGAADFKDLKMVISRLRHQKLIECTIIGINGDNNAYELSLTFDGWEEYERLKTTKEASLTAFMAMDYKNQVLMKLYEEKLKPAINELGFQLYILRERLQAGLIDHQLRVAIRRAAFLIVDLSDANAGAYWEAGFAEGLDIPVIYFCEKAIFNDPLKKPHFDTNHCTTVIWEQGETDTMIEELQAIIKFTLPARAVN